MKRYYLYTYGCQMNVRDSELLAGQMEEMGYTPSPSEEGADLVLINSCAVRGTAEEVTFGQLGRLKAVKESHPGMRIALCGCMAQERETQSWIRQYAPHVDAVFGTHNLHQLPAILDQVEEAVETVIDVWESAGEVVEHLPSRRDDPVRAFVNIIYGCDKYCTYCIVPFTRGRERSRRPNDVLMEVRQLAAEGYQEITLLGQNVNSYGHDLSPRTDLADLLQAVDRIPGPRWMKFLTSHPRDFSQKLIDTIAASRKVSEHIHLPVQSGSDRVLKRMNRKYTRESYLDLVGRIRKAVPEAVLTTDIIVGFPGETEEDFRETLSLVEEVRFDNAFTFMYSPRERTPASRWEERDPVPTEEKKSRLQRLNEVQYRISREANEALVGRTVLVLVEGPSKKDPGVLSARTRAGKLVLLPFEAGLEGRFIPIVIRSAQTWSLKGERVGEPLLPEAAKRLLTLHENGSVGS